MFEEITPEDLANSRGHTVEVVAFGMSYVGTLHKVDWDRGIIELRGRGDRVVLEIERIELFRALEP